MSELTGDMRSAVESAFSAASTPDAAPTTTVDTPAPSATETATTDVTTAAEPTTETTEIEPKDVPYARFKEVNEKAKLSSKELEALGWARGVDPRLAQASMELLNRAHQNPLAFTEELESLKDHPTFGPQLKSWAARMLGTRITSAATDPAALAEEEPQPDLQLQDGTLVYSAAQQKRREAWLLKDVDSRIASQLQPLQTSAKSATEYVARQELRNLEERAWADGKAEIDALSTQPHFNDHKADILAEMQKGASLKEAWASVFVSKVVPKLAKGQAATVQQKLDAASVNPARPSGAVSGPPKDFHEALTRALVKN